MTSSGSTDFSLSRNDIIEEAFQLIQIGQEGEPITAAFLVSANRSLNMMVKTWMADGIKLWKLTDRNLGLAVGKATYTLSPRPLEITNVRIKDGAQETPIISLSRQEYFTLPNKESRGTPVNWYYDPQVATGVLYIWPTPSDATKTIKYTSRDPLEDFDTATDTPDFPQEWFEALAYNLAIRLAPKYSRPLDEGVIVTAASTLATLKAWGQENESVYVGLDTW